MTCVPVPIGNVYGRWTVLARAGQAREGSWLYRVRCVCGAEAEVRGSALRSGRSLSCGCLREERRLQAVTRHGHAKALNAGEPTLTYTTYMSMRQRCLNPNAPSWRWYGERGITICDRWLQSFANFLEDMGDRPADRTLDRIDANGNYEPGNCRWATASEQVRNRRSRQEMQAVAR